MVGIRLSTVKMWESRHDTVQDKSVNRSVNIPCRIEWKYDFVQISSIKRQNIPPRNLALTAISDIYTHARTHTQKN